MRHFIFTRPVFAGAVSARSRRMPDPAAAARLVAPPRRMQRPPARTRRAVGAVDVAPIAIAADQRLNAAVWLRAQEKPGPRQEIMVATATLAMHPPMAWTRAAMAAKMPLQSCLCTVCGTAPKQNWPVMDRRRACLPIPAGSSAPASQIVTPEDCPGGSTGTSHPRRVAAREGRSAPGAGPSYGLPGQSEMTLAKRRRQTEHQQIATDSGWRSH
jgi:hypothetical protein